MAVSTHTEEGEFLNGLLTHLAEYGDGCIQNNSIHQTILGRYQVIMQSKKDRLTTLPAELILRIGHWIALTSPLSLGVFGQLNKHLYTTLDQTNSKIVWRAALETAFKCHKPEVPSQDPRSTYWTKRHWKQLCANEYSISPECLFQNSVQTSQSHLHYQQYPEDPKTPSLQAHTPSHSRLSYNHMSEYMHYASTTLNTSTACMQKGVAPFGPDVMSCGTVPYTHTVAIPGTRLLVGCRRKDQVKGQIWIIEHTLDGYEPIHTFVGHQNMISCIIATEDSTVITASLDSTIKVWDISETASCIISLRHTLRGHAGWVNSIAVEGYCLVSGGSDDTVRKWNLRTGEQEGIFRHFYEQDRNLGVLTVSLRHGSIGIGSVFGPFYVMNIENQEMILLEEKITSTEHQAYEQELHQAHSSTILLLSEAIVTSSHLNNRLNIWGWKGEFLGSLNVEGNLHEVQVSRSEEVMMATTCDGVVKTWDFTLRSRTGQSFMRRLLRGDDMEGVSGGSVWLNSLAKPSVFAFETTLQVENDLLSVFNVVIRMPTHTVSLIRYQCDFIEFHQKIRLHYPKSKIPFPALSNPSTTLCFVKRRSIRNLLSFNKKSNADKIENYLNCCFQHSIVSISSILRDFISVQREEDSIVMLQKAPSDTISQSIQYTDHSPSYTSQSTDAYSPSIRSDSIQSPLSPARASLDDFELLKVLGKGCMGKVLLVRNSRNSRLYALKAIKKGWVVQQKEVTHTLAERDILVRLRGQPFLVTLHHAFQTPSQLYLVLDYYGGGDIATQMSLCTIFSKERARLYVAEILHGLSILHSHGIVYRDLKPENILIGLDGHIVLADFGLSKIFGPEDLVDEESGVPSTHTFCGTAEYLAPEVLVGEPYSYTADFWSLGTLLYEMLAGITPFWAETHMEMYERVIKDSLEFPSHFDSVTRDFISGLLARDAHKRLGWGVDGADRIKGHPYFDPLDWEDVIQRKLQPDYVPALKSETDLANFDDMFVSMSPRISIVSEASFDGSEMNPTRDPFENFGYDPLFDSIPHSSSGLSDYTDTDQDLPERTDSWISQQPSRTVFRSLRSNNQSQRLGRERLSSSSSFLSFSAGDIARHTNTIPSLLSNSGLIPRKQKLLKLTSSNSYMRKRHSAALSVAIPDPINTQYASGPSFDQSSNYDDQERVRTIKKRQTTSSTIESFGPNSSSPSYTINHAFTRSPESSIRDLASIYSKSSMTLVSRPSNTINNLVRGSSDYSLGRGTRFLDRLTRTHTASPYTRPHCPVPGQIRPDISVAGPSTAIDSPAFISTSSSLCSDT
ncbi:hypothetical protein CLU79DRAFT_831917 [Phycomyces nitens]|nr:hypothetical protein CLU79DRAFT_831917 [Phycomyces nitens]